MGQIGEILRKTREDEGLSLRDVEEATKIRMKYLEALENENFQLMPGRVYVIGFIRTYARYLEIDEEVLVSYFKEITEHEIEDEEVVEINTTEKAPTKKLLILLMISAIVVVGVLAYVLNKPDGKSTSEPNTEKKSSVVNPEIDKSNNDDLSSKTNEEVENNESLLDGDKEISNVSVIVNVKNYSCWIDVSIDGERIFQGTLKPGESRTFTGSEIVRIKYGNAGAVEEIVNGVKKYPVGENYKVITKEYVVNNN